MIARLFAVSLLVVAAAACDEVGLPGFETPSTPSGIQGLVVLGPTCPVESTPGAGSRIATVP